MARALDAGNIGVNTTSLDGAYEIPLGGFDGFGIRRRKGRQAILEWTEVRPAYMKHD